MRWEKQAPLRSEQKGPPATGEGPSLSHCGPHNFVLLYVHEDGINQSIADTPSYIFIYSKLPLLKEDKVVGAAVRERGTLAGGRWALLL
jgi:hypothetical protein